MTTDAARPRLEALMLAGSTHPDYKRCIDLATEYRDYATGNVANRMRRYARRESDQDYAARVNMTTETVSSSFSELKTPYYTVARLRGASVTKSFDYPDASPEEASRLRERAVGAANAYFNQKPLEDYLSEQLARSVMFSDPNAWLLTTFGPFDFRTGLARPFPQLLPCEAVVDFTRAAGTVEAVTFRLCVSEADTQGWRYLCYLDNDALEYWPVLHPATGEPIHTLPGGNAAFTVRDEQGKALWEGRAYRHGAGRVPATPIGYVPDEVTEGRTFQSPLAPAMPYLRQMLKVGSESDIVMAQMAMPIRVAYVEPCVHCNGTGADALAPDGICGVCKGSGKKPVVTTAAETVEMTLPKDVRDVTIKPSDLIYFAGPSSELPKLQLDYLQSRRELAAQAVGQVAVKSKVNVTQTATERMSQLDQQNTALTPFADQFSHLYVYHATTGAAYVDAAQGLSVTYRFPAGLNLKTEADLYAELKEATDSGAPSFVIEQITNALAIRLYSDEPEQLRRYSIKSRFITFLGLSTAQFLQLAALGYMTTEERVLRTHADSIFAELETERPDFYDLAQAEQQRLVNLKAAAIVAKLGAAAPAGGGFARLNVNPQGPASGGFAVGDTVMVKPGMEHMPEHKGLTMTVAQVQGNTYAVKLPDGSVHKWYTADELMGMSPAAKPATSKAPAMAM